MKYPINEDTKFSKSTNFEKLHDDPTLELLDSNLAYMQEPRSYLGMSSIGEDCWRKLWYGLRWSVEVDSQGHRNMEDGQRGEIIMALRLVIKTNCEITNCQKELSSPNLPNFKGHIDGIIIGLEQAPKTPHIWEHKVCNEKKWNQLNGDLREWDQIYYAQAVCYMEWGKVDRHYLTCSTPGERKTKSVRTKPDPKYAQFLLEKTKTILAAATEPERTESYKCKWCPHYERCFN